MNIPTYPLMALNFLVAAGVSYGGGFVPSEDPATKLIASGAVAAVSTFAAYGAGKAFGNWIGTFVLGSIIGFAGGDYVSDDFVKAYQSPKTPVEQTQTLSRPGLV